ncbi:stage II sporulation protein E [Peptostreptococcus sp. MV1]|uniref:GAF domain-containing SpoIIE family protein phosphatase n=1 Tax=Peptostreptococcus sp. MV1 TaxID=1219626 RepID=UPI00050DAF20|nr:SpoIIE family protein phosphatase [Peptostreptococcus sp. MV1]KGF15063.1 stage II sporulation protein E [Peptostreptococcus sp. MV1]
MSNIERMKNLVEITKIVTSADSFYEVKDLIISKMLNVVHPTKACVNLFYGNDYNYAHLVCSATLEYIPQLFNPDKKYGAKIDFDTYPEYIHEAVDNQKVIVVDNILEDPRAGKEVELASKENYVGRAVFPFVINHKTVGFMTCYLRESDFLTDDDIDFITQVASLMTLSISITQKNSGISKLINKLRNSVSSLNNASKQLYSTKDMYDYLRRMAVILQDTTNSTYCLLNIYNLGSRGDVVGQKISIVEPIEESNYMNKMMPYIIRANKISAFGESEELAKSNGKNARYYLYYKLIIDSKTQLILWCISGKKYTKDDQNTLSALSRQIGMSMQSYEYTLNDEKHRNIDNELNVLKRQQELIMKQNNVKTVNGKEIFYYHKSAKVVGGDFHYAIETNDHIVFIIADVMGHGIISNYIVATMKGAFNALVSYVDTPAELLTKINKYLYDEFDKMSVYSTALVGTINKNTKMLTISNAGHYLPIMVDQDYRLMHFEDDKRGIPVGILDDTKYENMSLDIKDTKGMLLFTDGIVELKNADGQEFGVSKLEKFFIDHIDDDKEEFLNILDTTIKENTYDEEKRDDILLVVIK